MLKTLKTQQCTIQPILINLHSDEYGQGLLYHLIEVNLDRCVGNCSPLNDLYNRPCVPDKT